MIGLLYVGNFVTLGYSPLHMIGFPFGAIIMLIAVWRSTVITLRHGGIRWRGTFYPLKLLKSNKV